MAQQTRFLVVVVALVLLAAGVAAGQSLLAGPSAGLAVDNTTVAQSTTQGSTPTTTTPGSTTGTTGTTTPGATTGGTTTGGVTTGGTTTPTPIPSAPTTATPGAAVTNGMTVDQIVSLTRTVDANVPAVNAFTVPPGRLFVVTDVVITNAGSAPACGASIAAGGAPAAPTTPGTATPTAAATSESGTGVLCVPAQTSLNLGLTTGLEFGAGQSVVLANAQSTSGAALHYHLRGFLATPSGA
jgi:hypothetical protein